MVEPIVTVEHLSKRYRRMHNDRPRTIMEAALAGFRKLRAVETFWALQDISFSVMPGEMVGVLGHNGAGKSTLLQILSGIVRPDGGHVQVRGRMGALLDLGSGFHEDLTGRENVYINAIIGGLTRREAENRFEQILEFAELEDFIDNPLRTYSAGMQMRLGFAVAIHTNPDVMFIDEFLSVGDLAFQAKCLDRIVELKKNGCAIVLISHNPTQVKQLCDTAIWLESGRIKQAGEPGIIAQRYVSKMDKKLSTSPSQHGNFSHNATLQMVELLDEKGRPLRTINCGEAVTVAVHYDIHRPMPDVVMSISVQDADGQIYFNTNSGEDIVMPCKLGAHHVNLTLDRLDLARGEYFVNVGLHSSDWYITHDYHWHQHELQILSERGSQTILEPPRTWSVLESSSVPTITSRAHH